MRHPINPELYQVLVLEERTRRILPVGPRGPRELADELCGNILAHLRMGKLHGWSHPCVVRFNPPRPEFPIFGAEAGNIRALQEVAAHGTTDEYVKMRAGGTAMQVREDFHERVAEGDAACCGAQAAGGEGAGE